MKLADIDFSGCRFVIDIDDEVRRGLIHHFKGWITSRLAAQGVPVTPVSAINSDSVEAFAWQLSRDFLEDVARMIDDTGPDACGTNAGDVVRGEISESLDRFLADVTGEDEPETAELSKWAMFIDRASDAPLSALK